MSHAETKKFSLGRIVATPAALEALHNAGQQPGDFLARHVTGDWGDLDDEDRNLNNAALIDGSRILGGFRVDLDMAFVVWAKCGFCFVRMGFRRQGARAWKPMRLDRSVS